MAWRSFSHFIEQEIGKFPHFVLYAILEWILISLLFVDGFLAFIASGFAKFFELKAPCLFCTRIDHVVSRRDSDCYYNDSICEGHKKDVSSLAYCHIHRKLSDIRIMCDGCLLSFSLETKPDCVGAMNKNLESLFSDELRARIKVPFRVRDEAVGGDNKGNANLCSCCGEPIKVKSYQMDSSHAFSSDVSRASQDPTASPRIANFLLKNEVESHSLAFPHFQCREFKLPESSTSKDKEHGNLANSARDDPRAATVLLLTGNEDPTDDASRTPTFPKGSRFFSVPLSDSPNASPRWAHWVPKKSLLDRVELAADPLETGTANESDDSILNSWKGQIRLDRKTLIALYMELDKERSASAIAANNAMAMITRLQAEKSAVQMEALQYQRILEDQAVYDQEALHEMRDVLSKREEEIRQLEDEVDLYREKYGPISDAIINESFSSFTKGSERGSPRLSVFGSDTDVEHKHENLSSDKSRLLEEENEGDVDDELPIDFEHERSYLLGQLRMMESKLHSSADNNGDMDNQEAGSDERDVSLTEEVSQLGKKLRALEADSRFLHHTFLTLQKGGSEGSKLLAEIAGHLQELRRMQEMRLES